jgi:GxxExxY protein
MESQRTQSYSENQLSKIILNSAIKVHRNLGPGLLESAYQKCLSYELTKNGLNVEVEKALPLTYEDVHLEAGYRIDIFVNKKLVIEIKALEALNDVHLAQILTYLKLSDCKLGLLINFNVALLKHGFKRVVNNL